MLREKDHRRAPEEQHRGIPAAPASLGTQLTCLCVSACSTGNKQEELGTCTRLSGYDLTGIELELAGL